jgi:acyl carrier protein
MIQIDEGDAEKLVVKLFYVEDDWALRIIGAVSQAYGWDSLHLLTLVDDAKDQADEEQRAT